MTTARVLYREHVHAARPHAYGLQLDDGTVLAEHEVTWLPPVVPRTVIALGLNYAAHRNELAGELSSAQKEEPLVFFKTASSIVGHRGHTVRPHGVQFMHYECELAVVIGRTARRISRVEALAQVAGYTVCNDYAVRDHLENWYRPNLRAKNRDASTVLGPWLVNAADVPDPQALALRTRVNGRIVQQGHTRDMVHGVAELIEYLSEFMTLEAGDMILTGTPDGVSNVNIGDEVVCEIDSVGALVNTLVADDNRAP